MSNAPFALATRTPALERSVLLRVLAVSTLQAVLAGCQSGVADSIAEKARKDDVAEVAADDPAMLRAFAKASATLDEFLKRVESHDGRVRNPAVKVRIEDDGQAEYFWLVDLIVGAGSVKGVINNDPEMVKNVRNGQVLTVPISQIYDWTYLDGTAGRMMGNFTACALLSRESADSAREFEARYKLDCDF